MMGNKKLSTIVEQLKKHADPIASLEARLDVLGKQTGKSSTGREVRVSLERILKRKSKKQGTQKRQALRIKP